MPMLASLPFFINLCHYRSHAISEIKVLPCTLGPFQRQRVLSPTSQVPTGMKNVAEAGVAGALGPTKAIWVIVSDLNSVGC